MEKYSIAVAGTGYVGLSIATLLAQHNHVTAVDVIPEKVEMINRRQSPIQDEYIEKYLAEKPLDLTATLDGASAYGCRWSWLIFVGNADEAPDGGSPLVELLRSRRKVKEQLRAHQSFC